MSNLPLEFNQGPVADHLAASSPLLTSMVEDNVLLERATELPLKQWAVMTVGRQPGVFFGTEGLMENVANTPGSHITKYTLEEEARAEFLKALNDELVVHVTLQHKRTLVLPPPPEAYAVPPEMAGNRTVHVVFVGREPDIFMGKAQVPANIMNIPGARCEKFTTLQEATSAWLAAIEARQVFRVIWKIKREILTPGYLE